MIVLRVVGSLFLAAVMFAGFVAFLLSGQVRSALLDAGFYTETLASLDVYNRIYDEVLRDPGIWDDIQPLVADIDVPRDDAVTLIREVVPPEYAQSQTETAIGDVVSFLKGDTEELELFLDLSQPIDRIRPAVLDFVDKQIDDAEVVSVSSYEDMVRELEALLGTLQAGRFPDRTPSFENVPSQYRAEALRETLDGLKRSSTLSSAAVSGLEERWGSIEAAVMRGDEKEGFKLASRAVVGPQIDVSIAELRSGLDSGDRWDVTAAISDGLDLSEMEFQDGAGAVRRQVDAAQGVGPWVSLVVMGIAAAAMGLLYLPYWRFSILWPSLTLLVIGVFALAAGMAVRSQVSGRILTECGNLPGEACDLVGEVLGVMASRVSGDIIAPAIVVTALGAVGVAAAVALFAKRGNRRPA